MDLVADMLLQNLHARHAPSVQATRIRPKMVQRFGRVPSLKRMKTARNADRFINRFWDYPRRLKRRQASFDLFHVIDHSYGQLVHHLPLERTVVTCHDLDAFRCLIEPNGHNRSWLFRAMARRTLSGFSKAARIVCDSRVTRDQLLAHGLVSPGQVEIVPLGVHPTCCPEPDVAADAEAARLLGHARSGLVDILHVGSTMERKRIDVLLRVFSSVRKEFPRARLLRVGGEFTPQQMKLVEQLELKDAVVVLPYLEREVLAAVYRRAALVLQPSDGEGFGLPVVEAMACGTPVVSSDLAVLREVGGEAATYCPVADVHAWTETVTGLLREKDERPEDWEERRAAGLAQASRFSWAEYTRQMVSLYMQVLNS